MSHRTDYAQEVESGCRQILSLGLLHASPKTYNTLLMGRKSREKKDRRVALDIRAKSDASILSQAVTRGCLVCRQGDGGFDSVEHVFPESLGNKDKVLPRGVVCDRCNNGTLALLDQTLLDFMPVAFRRMMLGIPNKAGELRRLSLQGETYEHLPNATGGEPTLRITSKRLGRHSVTETKRHADGRVELQMTGAGGRRFTPRYASQLSRSLLKLALECAWIDHGENALASQFDHIRTAICGEPWDGFFAFAKHSPNPNSNVVSLSYDVPRAENGWRMPVWLNVYGVVMHTDSRLDAPAPEISKEDWNIVVFTKANTKSNRRNGAQGGN